MEEQEHCMANWYLSKEVVTIQPMGVLFSNSFSTLLSSSQLVQISQSSILMEGV